MFSSQEKKNMSSLKMSSYTFNGVFFCLFFCFFVYVVHRDEQTNPLTGPLYQKTSAADKPAQWYIVQNY